MASTRAVPEAQSQTGSVPVSTMIFTLNEELHLPSCLGSLAWCDDVIVIDSFSTDGTERICHERGVRFVQHPFEGFGTQRNWALDNVPTKHPWVLILDADERISDELAREMVGRLRSVASDVGGLENLLRAGRTRSRLLPPANGSSLSPAGIGAGTRAGSSAWPRSSASPVRSGSSGRSSMTTRPRASPAPMPSSCPR